MPNKVTLRFITVTLSISLLCSLHASATSTRPATVGMAVSGAPARSIPDFNSRVNTSVNAPVPAFTLSALTPATLNLLPGQASMVSFFLTANATFSAKIALTCSGATVGIECLVSPASMTLAQGQTVAATIAVATQGASANLSRFRPPGWIRTTGAISLSGVTLMLAFKRRKRFRDIWAVLLLASLGLGGSALIGCSGGSSKPAATPVGNTNLIITATSGNIVQTQTLTVSVTQP
jgi:hypothetical protein